jgi:ketosteroid isomerase-like protein
MSTAEASFDVTARDRRIRECFTHIDQWDFDGLRGFFADDVVARLSNGDETRGLAAFVERASQARAYVTGIRHTILAIHHSRDAQVATVECDVDYTGLDGVTILIPGAAVLCFGPDGLVMAYRVYANNAMLARAAPARPSPPTGEGTTLTRAAADDVER